MTSQFDKCNIISKELQYLMSVMTIYVQIPSKLYIALYSVLTIL